MIEFFYRDAKFDSGVGHVGMNRKHKQEHQIICQGKHPQSPANFVFL